MIPSSLSSPHFRHQPTSDGNSQLIVPTGEATGIIEVGDSLSPIQVIGTESIRAEIGKSCIQQAVAVRKAPGVSQVILNPDAHFGHGVPVGSVLVSPSHIYPGPVGVDIKCSMSLLQTDVPEEAIQDHRIRRRIIREIESNLARGVRAARNRNIDHEIGRQAAVHGASIPVLQRLGIPTNWISRCEDSQHLATDGSSETLALRLDKLLRERVILDFGAKCKQLGSYGGGNHFGECEIVRVGQSSHAKFVAERFGLKDGCVAFLSHCGSRGLGHALAVNQFRSLQNQFRRRGWEYPSGEPELVYAEYGTRESTDYLNDMALGANFATVNHLLINAIVLQSIESILPGARGKLVYFISHNIIRRESLDGERQWVHRKGATRAFPANHPDLQGTEFFETGHPILLPGNPRDGSSVMVAQSGAKLTAYSVNHGAGRKWTRTAAKATFKRSEVDASLANADVVSNARHYPIDEAPDAYKSFTDVLASVEKAGLAVEVAKLQATFVIKDN